MSENAGERSASAQQERGRARRDQVMKAAAELFAEHGFHGSSMSELARRAGMSVGHIYHYFQNKDAIIEALIDQEMERRPGALAALSRAEGGDQADIGKLDDEVRRVLDRQQMALWVEILAEAARNPSVAEKLHVADLAGNKRLIAAISARLPDLGKREIADRAGAVAAIFHGLIVRAVYNPGVEHATVVRTVRLALRELLTAPQSVEQSSRRIPKRKGPQ